MASRLLKKFPININHSITNASLTVEPVRLTSVIDGRKCSHKVIDLIKINAVILNLALLFSSIATLLHQYGITNEPHYDSVTAEYYFPKPQDTHRTSWFSK